MKKPLKTALIVLAVICIGTAVTMYNNYRSKLTPVEIDAKYLANVTALDPYDVKEVLYVEKFTENESVAFAVSKDSHGLPYVWALWDGQSRYSERMYIGFTDMDNAEHDFNDPYHYVETEVTEYGRPYFSLFLNPQADTLTVDGKKHDVFQFDCTVDGVQYHLGFYCGLKE